MKRIVETRSPAETRSLAASLLKELPDRRVYALRGELGSGKTCFVQGLAAALGVEQAVTSPTYTLVNEYETPSLRLAHMDLYRLRGPEEALDFGLDDYLAEAGVLTVIEWAERAGDLLPRHAVWLWFCAGERDGIRRIVIEWE